MDDSEIPDDMKDEIEVIYLDGEDSADEMEENFNVEVNEDDDEELPVVDVSALTFAKHEKSVFSSDISNDGQIAVTGGEDDMAFVWSTSTGEIIMECTGHKDSVTEVSFSYNNQYVVTGDMSGLIQVWNLKEKKLIWCYEGDDLEWLQWHHMANVLFAGSHSGDVYIWQIPQGNCKILTSHGSPTTCGKILPDGKQLIVGYRDGLKLWDIKTTSAVWQMNREQSVDIHSLDVSNDGSLIITAPTAHIIKVSDGKVIGTYLIDGETEVEVVTFNSDLGVVATGSLSGQLCVWDLARQTVRHTAKIGSSVTVLEWGDDGKLFVATTDGAIYVCDAKSGTLIDTLTGHKDDVLSLSLSNDGKYLLTSSDDSTAKIFTVKSN